MAYTRNIALEDLVTNITVEISELQESRVEQGRVNEELQRGMAEHFSRQLH